MQCTRCKRAEVLQRCKTTRVVRQHQAHVVPPGVLQFVRTVAIPSAPHIANPFGSVTLVNMLASRVRTQLPATHQRSDVQLRSRAICTCQLPSPKVFKPRQALTGLAAFILCVQSYTAQASPFSPGLPAGHLVLFSLGNCVLAALADVAHSIATSDVFADDAYSVIPLYTVHLLYI